MEVQQLKAPEFMKFWQDKQTQILNIAQKNTEEIVQRELALADFELLLSVNMPKNEQKESAQRSRELRNETWQELSKRFNGNLQKMNEFLDSI
jgi:hypothetical protein